MTPRLLPVTLLLALLLGGCQALPPRDGGTGAAIQTALGQPREDEAPPAPKPPKAVADALLPPITVALPPPTTQASAESRFDVTVDEAPAREFFLSLVEGTPHNLAVHPGVQGVISLRLKNVTVADVLETVRDLYGFDFRRNATGWQVFPATLQTRLYPVNYLNVNRTGTSNTRISSGQLLDSGSSSSGVSDGSSTLSGSSVKTESTTDFWNELQATLQAMLGLSNQSAGSSGRVVVVSPQAGVVTVRAMPDELREIETFLKAANLSINRQVILEAKILEVTLNDGYQAGINWTGLSEDGNAGLLAGQTGGGSLVDGETGGVRLIDLVDAVSGVFNPFDRDTGIATDAFGGAFSAALRIDDFAAFIELLSTQGNVQVLSSPRVATLNNHKAVIKVGSDEFFVTDVSTEIVNDAGSGAIINPDVTLTPFFSGIALDVTPQIGADGYITLHIHPTVSEVTDQQKTFTVSDQTQSLPLALSSVRESDSIIRARSGHVVVIGGLMKDESREDLAATPILGNLPFIGGLFRHTKQTARKSELVILLRPLVVESSTWSAALGESAERFRRLDRGFHAGGRPEVFGTLGELPGR